MHRALNTKGNFRIKCSAAVQKKMQHGLVHCSESNTKYKEKRTKSNWQHANRKYFYINIYVYTQHL